MIESVELKQFRNHKHIVLHLDPHVTVLTGPNGCIAGDTPILDPMDGSLATIKERHLEAKSFCVWSLDQFGQPIIARALRPVRYGPARIVRIVTNQGEIRTTLNHRLLSNIGWISSSSCMLSDRPELSFSNLYYPKPCYEGGPVRLLSTSDTYLQAHLPNAIHSTQTKPNSTDRCFFCSGPCGGLLLPSSKIDLKSAPSRNDVREPNHAWTSDAKEFLIPHTRPLPLFDLPYSNLDFSRLEENSPSAYLPQCLLSEDYVSLSICCCPTSQRSCSACILSCKDRRLFGPSLQSIRFWFDLSKYCSLNPQFKGRYGIVSACCIELAEDGYESYYDFHVPFYENYWACGLWHHNSGKSNLIRAVRWVSVNKPSGDSMRRRKGAKQADLCEVSLAVDGRTVTRAKGDGRNDYTLDGNKVAVPKTGVPKPVDELLSMGEGNFAMHWRGPAFWFGLTPGQAAKELNRIVNLDKIDSVLANASAKVRRVKAEQSVSEDRLKAAKIKKGHLVYVPKLVADWKALETLETELYTLQENESVVSKLLSEAESLKEDVDRGSEERQNAKSLLSVVEQAVKMAAEEDQIERLIRTADELEQEITESEQKTTSLQADLDRRCRGRCPVCKQPWPLVR